MALWAYDPLMDYSCMGLPCPRHRWRFLEAEPLTLLPESSLVHSLLSHGIFPRALPANIPREVVSDKDKYQVTINLGDFKSDEINVKLVDRELEICAKHEEKQDESGHVSRCIKRRYSLPQNVDFDHVNATMSDDGTLVVCAQKKPLEGVKQRSIEVKQVPSSQSQPSSRVSQKIEEEKGRGMINIPVSHEISQD
ncbi:hypothetical protein GHT06_014735 [Daphnia sinensis]|uniref:SHSP domain-containing protein n=1 Tax=Daphnia sinensis TaxID=1820382 RepID=A0AAD5KQA2_9CRUS|nr:hypothetical protein GHT06_014735 [Daphnia sinensis]